MLKVVGRQVEGWNKRGVMLDEQADRFIIKKRSVLDGCAAALHGCFDGSGLVRMDGDSTTLTGGLLDCCANLFGAEIWLASLVYPLKYLYDIRAFINSRAHECADAWDARCLVRYITKIKRRERLA